MINWVLQLNNSQSVNSFQQSFGKVQRVQLSKPTQSKPKPICDRSGKPEDTERVFVDKGKTSRSHEIDEKRLHKELGSSDRSGNLRNCLKTFVLSMLTMEQGNLWAKQLKCTHSESTICSCNQRENIDFNIPGVPHSAVKRSHGVNVRNLIQQIENHPQRHALQSDLQQHRQFNPFSKESQDVIKAAGNTQLCELLDVEPKAQCKACLAYWTSASSTARAVTSYEMIRQRTRSTSSQILTSSLFRTFTSGKVDHTVTDTERKRWSRISHCESTPKEV